MTILANQALKLLRDGRVLICVHTGRGTKWFVDGAGEVSRAAAADIIARDDILPGDDGLFDQPQTYRFRAAHSA